MIILIVQNIGFNAKILSQRTFTIFVVMALVTTFATTPLTSALYPPSYQQKLAAWRRGEIDWDGNQLVPDSNSSEQGDTALEKYRGTELRKLLVYLRLDSLPSLFTFVNLLGGGQFGNSAHKVHPQKARKSPGTAGADSGKSASDGQYKRPLEVHGLRMLELTERQSSVMKESDLDDYSIRDPVLKTFHTFAQLSNVAVSGEVQIVPEVSYAEILNRTASDQGSDLVLLPWSETGRLSEAGDPLLLDPVQSTFSSGPHNQFVTAFLSNATCNVAVFVNNGFGQVKTKKALHRVPTALSLRSTTGPVVPPIIDRSHHIFFPFLGGPDDRVALRFVLRLARNSNVTATIVNVNIRDSTKALELHPSKPGAEDPNYENELAFFSTIKDSIPRELEPRVLFSNVNTEHPLRDILDIARAETGLSSQNAGDIVIVGRGVRAVARDLLRRELDTLRAGNGAALGSDAGLGVVAEGIIGGDVNASVLVIQAGTAVQE